MKIKVISPHVQRAEQVARMLGEADPSLEVLCATAAPQALAQAVNGSRPSLVLVDDVDAPGLQAIARFTTEHPQVETLVLSAEQSPAFLLQAMQAGVREVLPAGADAAALRAAVQRAARRHAPASSRQGEVMAFIGCRGGNGTSVLAANLAHRLASTGEKRVALIDLDLHGGNALLLLSSQPAASDVAEVARNVQRLDADLLRSAMVPLSETLYVLPAPEDIAQALEVKAEHVQAIVRQARQMFDYVVLDLGGRIDALSLPALDQAAHVFPVLQLYLPQLRDARRMRAMLQSLEVPQHKLCWLVNRYHKNSELPLQALVQVLGGDPVHTVPNHFASVNTAANQGQPIAPNSPVVRALDELAAQRLAPPDAAPRKEGWFAQWFARA
ncbi:AAA family ATPase [Azohydromonas caseinilytica]|uniref:MinD/ParA family protein n=1 Tax=Azohydromonas caseinilytica TaxID=2728836 RepID=A0A848F9B1_9BURK|nr:AAA family ATPase [Azohydromonas caseinilytica]NML15305.1 MinD/ParA family protein [Azohydromonas caseinilytica]